MASEPSGIQAWLSVFQEAALDLADTSLRFDDAVAPLPRSVPGEAVPSAYIAILSQRESIHLGIETTPEGVHLLARAMLRIRADHPLEDADAVDGLSELLNIVAGKVKSRMAEHDGELLLGLPMFISSGRTHAGAAMEHAGTDLRLGPVPCRIAVYRRSRLERAA